MPNCFINTSPNEIQNLSTLRKTFFENSINQADLENLNTYKSIKPDYYFFLETGLSSKAVEQVTKDVIDTSQDFDKANSNFEGKNTTLQNTVDSLSGFFDNSSNVQIIHGYNYKYAHSVSEEEFFKAVASGDERNNNIFQKAQEDTNSAYKKTNNASAEPIKYIKFASQQIVINGSSPFVVKAPADILGVTTNTNGYAFKVKDTNLWISFLFNMQSAKKNISDFGGEAPNKIIEKGENLFKCTANFPIAIEFLIDKRDQKNQAQSTKYYFNPLKNAELNNLTNSSLKDTDFVKYQSSPQPTTPATATSNSGSIYTLREFALLENVINSNIGNNFYKYFKVTNTNTNTGIIKFNYDDQKGYILKNNIILPIELKRFVKSFYTRVRLPDLSPDTNNVKYSFDDPALNDFIKTTPQNIDSYSFLGGDKSDKILTIYFPLNFKLNNTNNIDIPDLTVNVSSDDLINLNIRKNLFSLTKDEYGHDTFYLKFEMTYKQFFKNVMSDINIFYNKENLDFSVSFDGIDTSRIRLENIKDLFSIVKIIREESDKQEKLKEENPENIATLKYNYISNEGSNDDKITDFDQNYKSNNNPTFGCIAKIISKSSAEFKDALTRGVSDKSKDEPKTQKPQRQDTIKDAEIYKLLIGFSNKKNTGIIVDNETTELLLNNNFTFSTSTSIFSNLLNQIDENIPKNIFMKGNIFVDGDVDEEDLQRVKGNFENFRNLNSLHSADIPVLSANTNLITNPIIFSRFLKLPYVSKYLPNSLYNIYATSLYSHTTDTTLENLYKKFILRPELYSIDSKFKIDINQDTTSEINVSDNIDMTAKTELSDAKYEKIINNTYALRQYIEVDLFDLYKEIITNMINIEAFDFNENA